MSGCIINLLTEINNANIVHDALCKGERYISGTEKAVAINPIFVCHYITVDWLASSFVNEVTPMCLSFLLNGAENFVPFKGNLFVYVTCFSELFLCA